MADLNALIAQGYQFQAPPDPFANYAKMQQLDQGEQTNQLNRMKMQEYQRGMEEQNQLRQLYSTPGVDQTSPEFSRRMAAISPTAYQAYIKSVQEGKKSAADIRLAEARTLESGAGTEAKKQQLAKDKSNFVKDSLSSLSFNPSDANITAFAEDAVLNKYLTPEQAQARKNQLLAMPIDQRKIYLAQQGMSTADTAKLFESKPVEKTDGQKKWMEETNPRLPTFGQRMAGASTVQMKATPGEQLTAGTAAARLAQEGQGVTYQQDAAGNIVAVPSKLAPGVAPVARIVTGEGGAIVKAKPTPFAEKTAEQQKQMKRGLDIAITELTDATKDGGLIDQSTGSGAGRLTDIAAGFVGQATPGAIAISKLQPIADIALKMVPRFEGPQSDKDTTSYKQAAGQLADPTLPTKIRKEAGKTVLRLMQNRKNQFVSSDMESSATPAPASTGVDTSNPLLK